MIRILDVNPRAFRAILSKTKRVEIRAGKADQVPAQAGDQLIVTDRDSGERLRCDV